MEISGKHYSPCFKQKLLRLWISTKIVKAVGDSILVFLFYVLIKFCYFKSVIILFWLNNYLFLGYNELSLLLNSSTNLLHSAMIIDETPLTRRCLAQSLAQQFFGCFISRMSWWVISKFTTTEKNQESLFLFSFPAV